MFLQTVKAKNFFVQVIFWLIRDAKYLENSFASFIVVAVEGVEGVEGVVAPWCNPLTLQPEQSGGVGSSPGRTPPLERHDKGSRT